MPFMDDSMLDLFGEDAVQENIAAAIAAEPESRALINRIDQSQRSGSCQRIAWSNNSCIARLSSDGRKIICQTLARSPETGNWALSDDSLSVVNAPDDVIFTHIEWSNSALDLLTFDQFGRVYIYIIAMVQGRLQPQPTNLSAPLDNTSAIVGTHWLPVFPLQNKVPVITPVTRLNDDWHNKFNFAQFNPPHNPQDGKNAFFTISRANVLRLVYQLDQPWTESILDLGETSDSGDLLTHAAFANTSDAVYLATHSFSQRLKLYRIRMKWSIKSTQDRQGAQPSVRIDGVQLAVEHLDILDHCSPQVAADAATMMPSQSVARARLSGLHIVPPSPLTSQDLTVGFQIFGLFTHIDNHQVTQTMSSSCSVISRWTIVQQQSSLHESFRSLKAGNTKSVVSDNTTILSRLPDVVIPKIVLDISTFNFESGIVLSASDGSIDFRSRVDLELLGPDGDDTKVNNLPQSGFAYLAANRCTDMALSASACMAACLTIDGTVTLNAIEYLPSWADASAEDHQTQAALCCLAREIAILIGNNNPPDEVLALTPRLDSKLRRFLIAQVYRTLGKSADMNEQDPQRQSHRVMRDNFLHRILGAHLILSWNGNPTTPDLTQKLVWTILVCRQIGNAIASTVQIREPIRVEWMVTLRPIAIWSVNLVVKILDDLFTITRSISPTNPPQTAIKTLINSGSPSLHFLLCSSARSLVRFVTELVRAFFVRMSHTQPSSASTRHTIQDTLYQFNQLPFRLQLFEQLTADTQNAVASTYASAQLTQAQKTSTEHALLIDAEVPAVLNPVITHLFTVSVPKLMDNVDVSRITFWEPSLSLSLTPTTTTSLDGSKEDIIRRVKIPPGTKSKQCRRCGSWVEDTQTITFNPRTTVPWVWTGMRYCVCMGLWYLP